MRGYPALLLNVWVVRAALGRGPVRAVRPHPARNSAVVESWIRGRIGGSGTAIHDSAHASRLPGQRPGRLAVWWCRGVPEVLRRGVRVASAGGRGGGTCNSGSSAGCVGQVGWVCQLDRVSVQGCWSEEAFTPGPGLQAGAGADTSCHPGTPSLRARVRSPDRPPPTGGQVQCWTGSSWRRPGPVAICAAWDTIWWPRTGCAVSEVPGTCPGSRQSRRSTPPAAQACRNPGGRASGGCRPDTGNPGAATGPRAV